MSKLKKYSFFIGLVGAILSCVGLVLDFFGIFEIMPIITEVVIIISTILVALGVVEKDNSDNIGQIHTDIKQDIENKLDSNSNKDNTPNAENKNDSNIS